MWKFVITSFLLLFVFSVPALSGDVPQFNITLELNESGLSPSSKDSQSFNVLDKAVWDPRTSRLRLIGHRDSRYKISKISYRTYLETILETSNPQVTLLWTEESKMKLRRWVKNLDSSLYLETFTRRLFEIFDENGRLKDNRRWLGEILGIKYFSDPKTPAPNRLEVLQAVFTKAGKSDAGLMVVGLFLFHDSNSYSAKTNSIIKMLLASSNERLSRKISREVKRGRKPSPKTLSKAYVQLLEHMEAAFTLPENSLMQIYFPLLKSQVDPTKAFEKASSHLMNLLPKVLYKDLRKILKHHQEIQIPSDILIQTAGFQPQMRSVYIGVKPDNPLANLLFRADFLSKTLPHQIQLQGVIPGYQTEFSYYRSHPQAQNTAEKIGIRRQMWLFPDSTDWSIGKDQNSLEIREVEMGFHSQVLENRKDVMVEREDYDEFLTAHYESLAQYFPVLHEIREAAKLAIVKHWLQDLNKRGAEPMPVEFNQGPDLIEGRLYLTLAPQFRNGVPNLRFVAEGGVSLSPSPSKGLFQERGKFTFSKDLSISHQKFIHIALKTLSQDLLFVKGEEKKEPPVLGLKGQ